MSASGKISTIKAVTSGNVTDQVFTEYSGHPAHHKSMIECGGRIVLGSGVTSVGVLVKDTIGRVLYNATITANTDIAPVPTGVIFPLYITTTSIAGGTAVTTYWHGKE